MESYSIKQYNNFGEIPIAKRFVLKNHYLKSLSRGNSSLFCLYEGRKLKEGYSYGMRI